MAVKNKVQLITYPDSLGGDLKKLKQALDQYFPGLFQGGIHILPPFPSSGDRGFAPLTYLEIDPKHGSWEDIHNIAEEYPVLLDMIVNHISARSPYFQDYLNKGSQSAYADLFLPLEKFWPGGTPAQEDLEKIFLRREKPYSEYHSPETGETITLWTTFGKSIPSGQVDINVNSETARDLLQDCLSTFSKHGVKIVRLDAVGYVIKKPGTSCFFVEPEIYDFLGWIKYTASRLGIEVLSEVHAEYPYQVSLAENGYWTYDFILPYLVLEALVFKNSRKLKEYLALRPHKVFSMLDCHDGIPVKPDLNGFLDLERARKLVELCFSRGGNPSRIFSPKYQDAGGFDIHQINGTFYSLLGEDDQAYLAARAIQLFAPGVPQVYYVGLLAGRNDEAELLKTGDGRSINRHNYSLEEIEGEMQRATVQRLVRLIQFRNSHPAFDGEFSLHDCSDHELRLSWAKDAAYTRLNIDLLANTFAITYNDSSGKELIL